MKFLLESSFLIEAIDIQTAKNNLETKLNKNYDNLNQAQKKVFISNILKQLNNYKTTISKAEQSIINNLVDSNLENKGFNKYIETLSSKPNLFITNQIIDLIYTLNKKGNIDFNRDTWLEDNNLYKRDSKDILYTIKALTFASDKELQSENGTNKYFDKPLKVEDLYKDGKLLEAEQIRNLLNSKQTKGFDISANTFKNNKISKDTKIIKNIEKVSKDEIKKSLQAIGRYDEKAQEIIDKIYDADNPSTDYVADIYNALGLNVSVRV